MSIVQPDEFGWKMEDSSYHSNYEFRNKTEEVCELDGHDSESE